MRKKRRKRKLPKSSSSRAFRSWKSGRTSTISLSSWPCSVSAGCLRASALDAWSNCGHMLMRQYWWLWTIRTVSTFWAATSSVLGLPEEYWGLGLLDSGNMRCVSLVALFALGSRHDFYVLLYLTINCQFLSRLRSTSTTFFWEITSGYAVFNASWFDSGFLC